MITCPISGDLLSPRECNQEVKVVKSGRVKGKSLREEGVIKVWSVIAKHGTGDKVKLKMVLG